MLKFLKGLFILACNNLKRHEQMTISLNEPISYNQDVRHELRSSYPLLNDPQNSCISQFDLFWSSTQFRLWFSLIVCLQNWYKDVWNETISQHKYNDTIYTCPIHTLYYISSCQSCALKTVQNQARPRLWEYAISLFQFTFPNKDLSSSVAMHL